ncbi:hypothetical protein NPIL_649441, partial [Nephila pilipes]
GDSIPGIELLTLLLREALGGNCLTVLIACIADFRYGNTEDTLAVLKLVSNARKISNKPVTNTIPVTHTRDMRRDFETQEEASTPRMADVTAIENTDIEPSREDTRKYENINFVINQLVQTNNVIFALEAKLNTIPLFPHCYGHNEMEEVRKELTKFKERIRNQ